MILGAVAACMDSTSELAIPQQQYQQQFQLLQPLQLLQEQLLLPTVRPLRSASLLDEDATVEPENIHRLLVLGAANVGKTSIVQRFLGHAFDDKYMPTVEEFHRKVYRINGRVYRLDIVDTSGVLHPFPAIRRLSLSLGDLFLLVYSIDCRRSFFEIKHLRDELLQVKLDDWTSRGLLPSKLVVPIVIAGNKTDRDSERQVGQTELSELANGSCCNEMSARTNANVNETFIQLLTIANLPAKMCPSLHRKLTATSSVTDRPSIFRRRVDNSACGALIPNVLRPDVQAELLQQQRRLNCADVERPQPTRVVIAKCCKCELL